MRVHHISAEMIHMLNWWKFNQFVICKYSEFVSFIVFFLLSTVFVLLKCFCSQWTAWIIKTVQSQMH